MSIVQKNKAKRCYAAIIDAIDADKVVNWTQVKEFLTIDPNANLPYSEQMWVSATNKKDFFLSYPYALVSDHVPQGTPQLAAKPVTAVDTTHASLMGVFQYRAAGNPALLAMLDAIGPEVEKMNAGQLRLELGKLVTYMADFPPTMLIGRPMTLTPQEYKNWTDQHNKDVLLVGPMLLFKILHRSEVHWEYKEIAHTSFVIFRRNGKELFTNCKYAVDGDWDDDDEREAIMREFLNGITVKAKQVQYSHVDYRVLRYLDYFNAHHDIESPGGSKPVTVRPKQHAPAHDDYLTSLFPELRKLISDDPLVSTLPDEILDIISRRFAAFLREDQLMAIMEHLSAIDRSLISDVGDYLLELKELCSMTEKDRIKRYQDSFGVNCLPDSACEKLAKAREIRNKPPTTQYVNKNVGSVMGSHLPQFVDTVAKFHCMKDYMENSDLLPTYLNQFPGYEKLPQPHLIFYGVAYMHGGAVARQMAGGSEKYYSQMDIAAAKGSVQTFEYGDVFTTRAPGCYIIDDAETKGNLGQKKAALYALTSEDTGDVAKLKAYVKGVGKSDRPLYIMAKVGLNSFKDKRIRKIIKSLLFPEGMEQPFTHVQLRKFGKLHNGEAFLELSNHPAHIEKTSWDTLMGDVRGVSGLVEVANDLIMMAQNKAVRFLAPQHIKVKDYVQDKVKDVLTPKLVWQALLDASTIYCPWYERASQVPLSGGTGSVNAINLDMDDDDFSHVSYKDADFKVKVKPKSMDLAVAGKVPQAKQKKDKVAALLIAKADRV